MKNKITISLDSYNIDAWQHELLWQCIHNNPTLNIGQLCKLLGIGRERFHKLCVKNQIHPTGKTSKILPKDLEEIPKFKP